MHKRLGKKCPQCEKGTAVKRINKATNVAFIGCDQFPKCKYSKDWNPKPQRRGRYYPTHMSLDIDEAHEQGYGNEPEDAGFYF